MGVVVTSTVLDANNDPVTGAKIHLQLITSSTSPRTLVPGLVAGTEIIDTSITTTDKDGIYTFGNVPGNDDISPTGTVYRILEYRPRQTHPAEIYIDVPTTGGPHNVASLQTSAPSALPSQAFALGSLTDVNTAAQADEYVLTYDIGTDTWIASPYVDPRSLLTEAGEPIQLED